MNNHNDHSSTNPNYPVSLLTSDSKVFSIILKYVVHQNRSLREFMETFYFNGVKSIPSFEQSFHLIVSSSIYFDSFDAV